MAKFYGQFQDDSFKRQMKENRKIEELILMYATHATAVLKKEPTLASDGWKIELNNHIAQFVKMLGECLRGMNHVSPELLSRLDSYAAKLAPAASPSSHSDSGYDSSSTSRDRDSYVGSSLTVTPGSGLSVADMALVRTVADLFKIPEQAIQREVDQLKGVVTEQAAMTDLKTCLKNINAGASFPGRREDFDTDAGWQHWRSAETAFLQQLVVAMVQANPELAKTTSDSSSPPTRPGSIYGGGGGGIDSPIERTSSKHASIGRRSVYNLVDFTSSGGTDEYDDDQLQVGHHFTFIPPSPRKYYKRLVELCLQEDLDRMLSPDVPDNEEVSLGILSQSHLDLLAECASRWRIGNAYRAVCFLDLVKEFFERESIPIQCVPEALSGVVRAVGDSDVEHLMVQDVRLSLFLSLKNSTLNSRAQYEYLCNVYAGLFTVFMSYLYHSMDQLPSLKPSEIEHFLTILDHVTDSGLLDKFDLDVAARFEDIRGHARQASAAWYDAKMGDIVKGNLGVNRALPLLMMTDEIEKSLKLLSKRFAEPLLGCVASL